MLAPHLPFMPHLLLAPHQILRLWRVALACYDDFSDFIPQGYKLNRIDSALLPNVSMPNPSPKAIVLFIGGFFDVLHQCVYKSFLTFDTTHHTKAYISYDCQKLLVAMLPKIYKSDFSLYIIAHSWGANNCLKALMQLESSGITNNIRALITLDCVGRNTIYRPQGIHTWENLFVPNHLSHINRPNIVALIGGARGAIPYADINFALPSDLHHASIRRMLGYSQVLPHI